MAAAVAAAAEAAAATAAAAAAAAAVALASMLPARVFNAGMVELLLVTQWSCFLPLIRWVGGAGTAAVACLGGLLGAQPVKGFACCLP